MSTPVSAFRPSWHLGRWVAGFHHLLASITRAAPCLPAVPLTRRQQLAAAQDLKKSEQRQFAVALQRRIRLDARSSRPVRRITEN